MTKTKSNTNIHFCKCLSKRMHFLPSSTHLTSRTSPLGMFLTIFLGLSLGSGKVFGVLISSTSVSAMEREILGTGAAVRLTGANAEHAAMATRRRATVKERIVGWWYVMRYGRVVASQSSGHRQQSSSSRKATSTSSIFSTVERIVDACVLFVAEPICKSASPFPSRSAEAECNRNLT